jgi:hypothetical protein
MGVGGGEDVATRVQVRPLTLNPSTIVAPLTLNPKVS